MDESNSQPTRCPCGFFGSPQTLGLCSKCFREREQNQNQAAADISRPTMSGSGNDQSRVSLLGNSDQSRISMVGSLSVETSNHRGSVGGNTESSSAASTSTSTSTASSSVNCSPCLLPTATDHHRGQKRKHDEVMEELESCEDRLQQSSKRERVTVSSKHCRYCNCRLELAVREIGKCKCGCIFCLLHRLPEQHDCTFDHKEDGRREARAKMVPARKHVGTTLKRLDSDS